MLRGLVVEGIEGAHPSIRVYEGGSKITAKPLLPVKTEYPWLSSYPCSQPAGHLALSLRLSSQLSWEVAKCYPSLLPNGSGGAPASMHEGNWSPANGCSSGGAGSHGTLMPVWSSHRLPKISPNQLFFLSSKVKPPAGKHGKRCGLAACRIQAGICAWGCTVPCTSVFRYHTGHEIMQWHPRKLAI